MYFSFENRNVPIEAGLGYNLLPEPHVHSHFEIVHILEGKTIATADDKSEVVEAGDIFIAFPNQIHFYHDNTAVKLQIVIFSPESISELSITTKSGLPEHPVIKAAGKNRTVKNSLDKIIQLYKERPLYYESELKGNLLIVMSEILRNIKLSGSFHYDNDLVKEIIRYCYENYTNQIHLEDIASNLHISKFYISHIFSNKLKISFNDYINSLRINKACELLKDNKLSVTDISYAAGYSSTRSFNRCFRKVKGQSPKEYRNAHRHLSTTS